jgi:cation transport ATPase
MSINNYRCFLLFLLVLAGLQASAGGRDTVVIKTSAHCEFCERDIVQHLKKQKGVRDVQMAHGSNEVKIIYNASKVSADSLRGTLNGLGYDADGQAARNRLTKFKKQQCTNR